MKSHQTKFIDYYLTFFAKLGLSCLLIIPTFAHSQERVLAVMSGNGQMYQDFFLSLKNNLHKDTTISKINHSEINNINLNKHKLIVSIGYKAAKTISKYKTNTNIVYSLIPDDKSSNNNIICKKTTCYKVYINQPVSRYIKLFKILFPKGKKIVFATTKEKSKKLQQVKAVSKNNNISYKNIRIQNDMNVSRALINNLNNNDVLLALPNPKIYSANNAKSIILSTYHANVPIIGYSKSFTKAGALISLYSSIDNVAYKTANVINAIITNGPSQQKEYYPDEFSIEINSAVALSLDINIDSVNVIKRKLK